MWETKITTEERQPVSRAVVIGAAEWTNLMVSVGEAMTRLNVSGNPSAVTDLRSKLAAVTETMQTIAVTKSS